MFNNNRLNELGAQKAQGLQERLRERRDIQRVSAGYHSTHGTNTATDTATAGRVKARTPPVSSRSSTSFSPERRDASNANPSESGQVKQKERTNGLSHEPPAGHGIQLVPPPNDDRNKRRAGAVAGAGPGASAGVGDDSSVVPSMPSLPSKTGAADIGRDSRGMENQQTAPGAGWRTIRERSSDDEVLDFFLARHAKEAIPPLREGTERQSPRCSALMEERGLENSAADSERETKVLW